MEINQEFIAAAEHLVNFLRKHKHPHAKIIVDQTGAELVEGTLSTGVAYDGSTPEPSKLEKMQKSMELFATLTEPESFKENVDQLRFFKSIATNYVTKTKE